VDEERSDKGVWPVNPDVKPLGGKGGKESPVVRREIRHLKVFAGRVARLLPINTEEKALAYRRLLIKNGSVSKKSFLACGYSV